MRYRLGAVLAVVALLVTTVGMQSATAGSANLTRLRVELWGTSDWQNVRIADTAIGSYFTEVVTSGASVARGPDVITLLGPGNQMVSSTVSMMVDIWSTASTFSVSLAKGKIGEAHMKLSRINDATPVQILALNNYETTGDGVVYANVSRSSLVGSGYTMPRMDPRRLVLTFYYPWFGQGTFDSGPWWDEPVDAYDTKKQAEVSKMVDQGKNAGIDGYIVSWDDIGDHSAAFDLAMSELGKRSMYAVPCIELLTFKTATGFDVSKIVDITKKALARSTNSAYLKVGSRPVLFMFGTWQMDPATLTAIRSAVNAAGYDPFWIGDTVDLTYGLDGSYYYNPNLLSFDELNQKYGGIMHALRYDAQVNPAIKQRLWAATVSPGQNMSYYNPLKPQQQDRKNGDRYDMTWGSAIATAPEWILITSWNEWFEATHISPSKKFGYQALNQTAGWSATFHNPPAWGGSSGGGLLPIPLPLGLRPSAPL